MYLADTDGLIDPLRGIGEAKRYLSELTVEVHGLTVVTDNVKHFARVEGLSILKPPSR